MNPNNMMFFRPYLSDAKPTINAERMAPRYKKYDPNPDSITEANDEGSPRKPNVPAATLNKSHETKYNEYPWVVKTAIHLSFLHTTLSQGSIKSATKLVALKTIIMARGTIDPDNSRNGEIEKPIRIIAINVMNIKTPETRPLSSIVVDSAKHARTEGNPSPKEAPTNIPENRENISPWKNKTEAVEIIPRNIQKKRNRLRFHFPLIMLPIIAETKIEA
jgi:hypothetical protein